MERGVPLVGAMKVDVAVVGAGIVGLVAALDVLAGGASVAVIDAGSIGANASGANAAHVMPMMWGMRQSPAAISQRYPGERGERMNAAVATAGRYLFEMIARHELACEANSGGLVLLARTDRSFKRLCAQSAGWVGHGGRFETLERAALASFVASDSYRGGVRLLDAGAVNPRLLTLSLAARVAALGGRVFSHSIVTEAAATSAGWRLRTPSGGGLECGVLLVAPGAVGAGAFAHISAAGYAMSAIVVSTPPLADHGKSILPAGIPAADMDDAAPFGPLIDATGALVLSALPGLAAPTTRTAQKIHLPRLRRAFPQLGSVAFGRITGGHFLVTGDGVPRVFNLGPNGFAAAGCNGSGHVLGVLMGRDLAKLALDGPSAATIFPLGAFEPAPLRAAGSFVLGRLAPTFLNL